MTPDLHLDPDGARRAARTARRIADDLTAHHGPSTSAPGVGDRQERIRESLRRCRDELLAFAADAVSAAGRVEDADRAAAAALRGALTDGPAR